MSLDPARTNMGARWINRKDDDFALTWVKPYGKGRIFNTSFGHMASLYSNPQVLQFYLDAIQFATGDLDGPDCAAREPAGPHERARHAARAGTGARFRLPLRRQDAGRLGRRPHDLDRRGRRHHRPDHGRHEAEGEQLPHLEGPGRELRAAAEVPAGRRQFGDLLPRPEAAGRPDRRAIRSSGRRPTSTPRAAGPA